MEEIMFEEKLASQDKAHNTLQKTVIEGEHFFKIADVDELRPFFMSIVSDANHWMFIASNGGLTAGRKNADFSLFPYYTDDKITESNEITGSKTCIRVHANGKEVYWEPFSLRSAGRYDCTRNMYKHVYGNSVIFEEINHDLGLTFTYQWQSSNKYGFIRKAKLINQSKARMELDLVDGLQNIIPYGVGSDVQNKSSNLVDAYKRNELIAGSRIGIYALSAIIVDKAEPSEALKANVAWSYGLPNATHLLSSLQLKDFRRGGHLREETDIKAEKGAYFLGTKLFLEPTEEKVWHIVANVNQDQAAISQLSHTIQTEKDLETMVAADVAQGTKRLLRLCGASDGMQLTNNYLKDARHFSNTLFNIMRGGIFDDDYSIEKGDFTTYLANANKSCYANTKEITNDLPDIFSLKTLHEKASECSDANFKRLCIEYLPLKFSRRHGDPSRPWNRFSINTHSEVDGSKILDYEGNWRDIFQNWEALALSYPRFLEGMIHKFLNASTFDGYNPYRVTKSGFDWETIEPDDPWSYIGYWGDHQIIYLLKLLELVETHSPGELKTYFSQDLFVYAQVPYLIKDYNALLANPKDTIDFDHTADGTIRKRREEVGADGALLQDASGTIYRVNLLEKLLATVLAKLSNFIPEGGIWMNTQRPEWNDANNALVGNGVSMVTLYYLRRFMKFFQGILERTEVESVAISNEVLLFFKQVATVFNTHYGLISQGFGDTERKMILDGLGTAGSNFRNNIYKKSFSAKKETLLLNDVKQFVGITLEYLEQSIGANKRVDGLYHAYNLMTVTKNGISLSYLSEMLEGQVAILSSGYLSSQEALDTLDALKNSSLFRHDQYSYLLYPNKSLPGFMEKNVISPKAINGSKLLAKMIVDNDVGLVKKAIDGRFHFNGNFKNANDLELALQALMTTDYAQLAKEEKGLILQIFEEVFNHKAFTGRSGTFYGYEGLGSIYWHMVSKLLLAAQECCLQAVDHGEQAEILGRLLEHYYEITEGIGVHKSPSLYGAFPTDPYSHTPGGKGAQQPGMTGQVKEDILSRFGELGVFVNQGKVQFNPCLLRKSEFLTEDGVFDFVDLNNENKTFPLSKGSLAFTYCQVPIVYVVGDTTEIAVKKSNGAVELFQGNTLPQEWSATLFERSATIESVWVTIPQEILK